eukprot:1794022-Pleurochrysis_carterae.AAC.2
MSNRRDADGDQLIPFQLSSSIKSTWSGVIRPEEQHVGVEDDNPLVALRQRPEPQLDVHAIPLTCVEEPPTDGAVLHRRVRWVLEADVVPDVGRRGHVQTG